MARETTERDLDDLEDNNPEATKVQEENATEIEAETSKPFDKREGLRDVDRYYNMKRDQITKKEAEVGQMFPRKKISEGAGTEERLDAHEDNCLRVSLDVMHYGDLIRASTTRELAGDEKVELGRIRALPEFKFIEKLAEAEKKIEAGRRKGKEVLDKREKNELKKKEDTLLAEIEKL